MWEFIQSFGIIVDDPNQSRMVE